MGNCININQSSSNKNISVLVSNGSEERFKVSTKVRKITRGKYEGYDLVHFDQPGLPLGPDTKLVPAEVYVLIPREDRLSSEVMSPQKVKIVVTRKQLEGLMRSEKDFQISKISRVSCWRRDGYRKWQPCMSTIQE